MDDPLLHLANTLVGELGGELGGDFDELFAMAAAATGQLDQDGAPTNVRHTVCRNVLLVGLCVTVTCRLRANINVPPEPIPDTKSEGCDDDNMTDMS
jgi:hypothetical protein